MCFGDKSFLISEPIFARRRGVMSIEADMFGDKGGCCDLGGEKKRASDLDLGDNMLDIDLDFNGAWEKNLFIIFN